MRVWVFLVNWVAAHIELVGNGAFILVVRNRLQYIRFSRSIDRGKWVCAISWKIHISFCRSSSHSQRILWRSNYASTASSCSLFIRLSRHICGFATSSRFSSPLELSRYSALISAVIHRLKGYHLLWGTSGTYQSLSVTQSKPRRALFLIRARASLEETGSQSKLCAIDLLNGID